jgi:hypothetical protein
MESFICSGFLCVPITKISLEDGTDYQIIKDAIEKRIIKRKGKYLKRYTQISFDHEKGEFVNMDCNMVELWKKLFPKIDVDFELNKIKPWLVAHPERKIRDFRKFITAWFTRNMGNEKSSVEYNKDLSQLIKERANATKV